MTRPEIQQETPDDEITSFPDVFRPGLSKNQVEFLYAYITQGSLRGAERESKISKGRHYEWLRKAFYVECFEAARRHTLSALESEAERRAVDGVNEPVFYKDKLVGHKRRFSDALLLKLLEANGPDKYGKRDTDNRDGTQGTQVILYNGKQPTDEELADEFGPHSGVRVQLPDNLRETRTGPDVRVLLPQKEPHPETGEDQPEGTE